MEEDKGIYIACVGHTGVGRTILNEASKRESELKIINIRDSELDEFERAGIRLTDEQKQKLREMGIAAEKLISLIEIKDPFEELAKKMNEVVKDMETKQHEQYIPITQSKPWKKKRFWE